MDIELDVSSNFGSILETDVVIWCLRKHTERRFIGAGAVGVRSEQGILVWVHYAH